MINQQCQRNESDKASRITKCPELRIPLQLMMDDDFKTFVFRHPGQTFSHETHDRQALWNPPKVSGVSKTNTENGMTEEREPGDKAFPTKNTEEDLNHA